MSYGEAFFLNLVLQVDHEQGSTFRHYVVFVIRMPELAREPSASPSVYGVDYDLQGKRQILVRNIRIVDVLGQFPVEHLLSRLVIAVLYGQAGVHEILEILSVRPEVVELYQGRGMHGRHV